MRALSEGELSRLKLVQRESLQCTCLHLVYVPGQTNVYGKPADVWQRGSVLPCGFELTTPDETLAGAQVATHDGTLRLGADVALNNRDRLRILTIFGQFVEPLDYDVVGNAQLGPSGLVAIVRLANSPTLGLAGEAI